MNHKIKSIILSSLLIIFAFSLHAQWDIPEEAMNMKIPSEPTYELVKKGKDIYKTQCISCHGSPTEGNNLAAINASDLGTKTFLADNTPGTIFFKVDNGKVAMPSFKDKLSDDEKWNVVYYVKSFDENLKIGGEKKQSFIGKIDLKSDDDARKVFANITVTNDKGKEITNEGVEVIFYVKRYFGNLPLGDPILTNEEGTAALEFPDDIPGDEEGKVVVIADFKDNDAYGSDIKKMDLNWGEPLHFVDETKQRTLWGPNNRVPLWLLFSYIFITGGVWLGIIYVIFQITRIKKVGK